MLPTEAGKCHCCSDAEAHHTLPQVPCCLCRLAAGTFKRLNLGLAALELSYAAVFVSALLSQQAVANASGVSNLVASVAIAAFCSWQWATAVKR